MIESSPIKNIKTPPYFLRIRGKFFMEFVLICSGVLILGILGGMILKLVGLGWTGLIVSLSNIALVGLIYMYYIHKGKSTPFKDIKKTADMISHINFNKINEC